MVELDSHASEVSQQLVGVGLFGKNAERTLQSFQLTRQLDVFLWLEGDDCCCRCGLEMHVHGKSHSSLQSHACMYAHDTRANDDGARQAVTFFVTSWWEKEKLVCPVRFPRKHHKLNIYSKYPTHMSGRE